jgi:hypothetical protein
MSDYIKKNSKRCNTNQLKCSCTKFQSYNPLTFGRNIPLCTPISCNIQKICSKNQYQFQKYVSNQQTLYAVMRRFPERFPIIPTAYGLNLSEGQMRAQSNIYYRRLGTSNALPVNDNWGGFAVTGSETPFTN